MDHLSPAPGQGSIDTDKEWREGGRERERDRERERERQRERCNIVASYLHNIL